MKSMRQPHTDVRRHILATGYGIISRKGFSAMGLTELLEAAQVPKGSFYHYFESKEQFGEALLEAYFADYLLRMEALLDAKDLTARDRLMRYWLRWRDAQIQDPDALQCLVVKLSAEVSDLSEAMRAVLLRGTDGVLAQLSACVAEGVRDGSLPGQDPGAAALSLYQLWLGASLLAKVRRDPTPFETALATTRAALGT